MREEELRSSSEIIQPLQTPKLVMGKRFKAIHSETDERLSGVILSRVGKATGKYKDCYNIRNDSDGSIDFIELKNLQDFEHAEEEVEMLILFNNSDVKATKELERKNWIDNEVFEEVEDYGQESFCEMGCHREDKRRERLVKARLVAWGFEEDTLKLRKDFPTCSKEGMRVAMSLALTRAWKCHTLDNKAAYLQGNTIERNLYLKPLPEFFNGSIWKLKKTVYGLCDAVRACYLRIKDQLLSLSATICMSEASLFY